MTSFIITEWRLSDNARRQLKPRLPAPAIDKLEAELIVLQSRWSARPDRRKRIDDLKSARNLLNKIHDATSAIDDWTAKQIQDDAFGLQPYGRDGFPRTQIPFRDFQHALLTYILAAQRAEKRLARKGPRAGRDPERENDVAHVIKTIFSKNDLPIGDKSSSPFVHVIDIVFKELAISGDSRSFARAVVAGKL